jgi:hypothetical protein
MFNRTFGPRANMMDGLGQQVDQAIGQLTPAQVHEGRQPGEPRRFRMSALVTPAFLWVAYLRRLQLSV